MIQMSHLELKFSRVSYLQQLTSYKPLQLPMPTGGKNKLLWLNLMKALIHRQKQNYFEGTSCPVSKTTAMASLTKAHGLPMGFWPGLQGHSELPPVLLASNPVGELTGYPGTPLPRTHLNYYCQMIIKSTWGQQDGSAGNNTCSASLMSWVQSLEPM